LPQELDENVEYVEQEDEFDWATAVSLNATRWLIKRANWDSILPFAIPVGFSCCIFLGMGRKVVFAVG
jgi:hypothetical protein